MKHLIKINERFKNVLVQLKPVEYRYLEESILETGCHTAIIVWNNQIIDGHNRFEICQKHNLDFPVIEENFMNENEAVIIILENQLGRRNLSQNEMLVLIGQLYRLNKERAGAPLGNTNAAKSETKSEQISDGFPPGNLSSLNEPIAKRTAEKIAEEYKISEKTVRRAEKIADAYGKVGDQTKIDFYDKKLSQKALLESVKKTDNEEHPENNDETQYPSGKDAQTEFMYAQAVRLEKAINNFQAAILKIKQKQPPNEVMPRPFEEAIKYIESMIEQLLPVIEDLKNYYTCEYCEANRMQQLQKRVMLRVMFINYNLG